MRIHVLSDVHEEKKPLGIPSSTADVVVLAGDIDLHTEGLHAALDLDRDVVYVAGNHEHYFQELRYSLNEMRGEAAATRVHFLENDQVVLHGTRFLGCTLWTDFDAFGPARRAELMRYAQQKYNDYDLIRRDALSPLEPGDTREMHLRSRTWLETRLAEPFSGPTVVVTHHAPSLRSVDPSFRAHPGTGAFASNLDDLVARSNAALWIHGHTHSSGDYHVGATRVLSNQRAYPDRPCPRYDPGLVVTLP